MKVLIYMRPSVLNLKLKKLIAHEKMENLEKNGAKLNR